MALTKVIGNRLGAVTQDGAAIFNEGSADVDFRVEPNGNANMLFIDGGNDKVGIGTASPDEVLHIHSDSITRLKITGSSGQGEDNGIKIFQNGVNTSIANGDNGYMRFYTNNTEHMRIDSTGAVTKPLQPAFLAQPSSDISNLNVSGSVNTVLVFAGERFDQNADYNTSNGLFTAPVGGKYQLQYTLRLENVDTAVITYDFNIVTSNRTYVNRFDPDYADSDFLITITLSVIADMDAGDTAKIEYYQHAGSSQTDVDENSTFSGFLVC